MKKSIIPSDTTIFRFVVGYSAAILYFMVVFIVFLSSFLSTLEIMVGVGPINNFDVIHLLFFSTLLLCAFKDKHALRRILLRCEAYARNINLKEFERRLGLTS
jgi:hypothetical protein